MNAMRWEVVKFGDVVSFKTGKLDSNAATPDGVYPFFTCSPQTLRTDTYAFDTECVLLAGNNANGVYPIKYFNGRFNAYQRTYVIRSLDDRRLATRFLFYALQPKLGFMRSISTGAATKFLTLTILNDLDLELPPLLTQRKIAAVLSAYDDLIENNTRRIRILEQMAQALYREWFVHFRFPGHEKVKLVDSPLGRIPEGWEVKKLGALISLDKGVSYNGAGLTAEGNPMVNLKNILPGGGFRRDATKPYSGDFKARHTVRPWDVVLANTDLTQAGNIVASPALIPDMGGGKPVLISHHLFAVRPLSNLISTFFLNGLFLTEDFRGFARGYALGTTVLGLPREGVLDYECALPPDGMIQRFTETVEQMYHLVENLHQRNETLRRTRDLLLPRLISGEVDVSCIDSEVRGTF